MLFVFINVKSFTVFALVAANLWNRTLMPFYIWALHYGNELYTPLHIWRQGKFVTEHIRWMNDSIPAWCLASATYYRAKETKNPIAKYRMAKNSIKFILFLLRMMSGIGSFSKLSSTDRSILFSDSKIDTRTYNRRSCYQ